ncbi:hypothetical protein [Salinicola halophilus]|uniref:hypothetical protein n=1 Tax=Salinicola halophilus TaxID=184065 RepID=UPI000DA1877D|nr:hypothetical protein [Salinicola halophilus]
MALLKARRRRKIRSALRMLDYRWKNRRRTRRIPSSDDRLIISLTTHPPRVGQIFGTLESLADQDLEAFDVHVYLSERDRVTIGELPETLRRLERRGVKIVTTAENYRSYDKLVHARKAHPDATIITADDDMLYPPDWAGRLLAGAARFPGSIVCHRGHMLCESEPGSGSVSYRHARRDDGRDACTPNFALMPTGSGGVLYPPGALDAMVFDAEAFRQLAPSADDIWFKMASLKAGTRCVRINPRNVDFLPTPASNASALHEENVKQGGNDRQFADCLARYPELKALIFDTTPPTVAP